MDKSALNLRAAERIRKIRRLLGLKQKELAQKLEIDPAIINRYEKGKTPIPAWVLIALEDMMGL